jgi:hypothetical protein
MRLIDQPRAYGQVRWKLGRSINQPYFLEKVSLVNEETHFNLPGKVNCLTHIA